MAKLQRYKSLIYILFSSDQNLCNKLGVVIIIGTKCSQKSFQQMYGKILILN